MTLLEAVNILLQSIGEDQVNSLDSGFVDANTARDVLEQTSMVVQTQGFWFNREFNTPIYTDDKGEKPIPDNTLSVRFQEGQRYVQRGKRVYDRDTRSYKISTTVTADIIVELPFEDIPQSCQNYIILKSARVFQDRVLGNASLHGFQQADETEALLALREDEALNAGYNMYQNSEFISLLDRYPNMRGTSSSLATWQRLKDV